MIMTNKLLPVALIAALVGGSVGALVMHSKNQPTTSAETAQNTAGYNTIATPEQNSGDQFTPAEFNTSEEQSAYKVGFADGFRASEAGAAGTRSLASTAVATRPARVVYRNSARSSSRPVYYSQQPKGRSFWQKHRDKLTVAIGAGSGAVIGGLIGDRKSVV